LDSKSTPIAISNQKSPIYKVHGHFAKRPFNVVNSCIDHYTKKGELVLDPFSGYGVTGIEALRLRRKAVVIDLNPVSVFVTKRILEPIPPIRLKGVEKVFNKLKAKVNEQVSNLHKTKCQICGRNAIIKTTIYDSQNDTNDPRKRTWKPISVTYDCDKHPRQKKRPDNSDIKLIKQIQDMTPEYWYPDTRLITNSRKSVYDGMTVEDIYTKRNLIVMSILRELIWALQEEDYKNLLAFTFSGILRSASMMVHEGGGGWQKSFHIPKKRMAERNVLDMFERKLRAVISCKQEVWKAIGEYCRFAKDFSELEEDKTILLAKWNATQIDELVPTESIHYVHTDPPYGDNIQYLELFLPHIAWLGMKLSKEDWKNEIIITDSPEFPEKQKVGNYHDRLVEAFIKSSKTLVPKRWMTIWFACQDEEIWKALRDSIMSSGLEQKTSYLVLRTEQQKSFGIKRAGAIDPLANILKEDLLTHSQKTGEIKLVLELPENTAIRVFLEVAENEIVRKGSAAMSEIYMNFVNHCLQKFSEPPPNLDYQSLLMNDKRFVKEVREKVGLNSKKKVTEIRWRLKGSKAKDDLISYIETNGGKVADGI